MKKLLTEVVMISIAGIATVFVVPPILQAFIWLYRQPFNWAGEDLQKLLIVALAHYIIVIPIAFWPESKSQSQDAGGKDHA